MHSFHFLSNEGTMAIILPHGVLFRGRAEERIRRKLLQDNSIDMVIGLPSNLFFSTGIPVCILVQKKFKKHDDVLFINASEHFAKGKRQNTLREGENGEPNDIEKIVKAYQFREELPRYSRKVSQEEIEKNGYNLNISRYVNTSVEEEKIDLEEVNEKLVSIENRIKKATDKYNAFLRELGLKELK